MAQISSACSLITRMSSLLLALRKCGSSARTRLDAATRSFVLRGIEHVLGFLLAIFPDHSLHDLRALVGKRHLGGRSHWCAEVAQALCMRVPLGRVVAVGVMLEAWNAEREVREFGE